MIEIAMQFELLPGKDQNAYAELAKAVVAMALEARGHRSQRKPQYAGALR